MQDRFRSRNALLTALAVPLTPILIYGQTQSGTLDPSLGTGGQITTDFGGSEDVAAAAGTLQLTFINQARGNLAS